MKSGLKGAWGKAGEFTWEKMQKHLKIYELIVNLFLASL